MPNVTYEFALPEEQGEYISFLKGPEYISLAHDWTNLLRNWVKYGDPQKEFAGKNLTEMLELISDRWWELLNEHGLDPYEE
jgi:hypothetical protein